MVLNLLLIIQNVKIRNGLHITARQPKDAVPGDETVRVLQYFINRTKITSINFGAGYKAALGWRKALN